ncbi:DUF192 domain-containing protein [Radicibacter daui]|uniref:DUF192 domain-containing protein n=1 Tax=Radicibacter daui TaxID=3064829 RepID=UPI004046C9D9
MQAVKARGQGGLRVLMMVLALMIGAGLALVSPRAEAAKSAELIIAMKSGRQAKITAEVVDTPASREQGLMFRDHLALDGGMLFVFDRQAEVQFWMRNTLIPLDMLFIDSAGVIRHIHERAIPHDETPISSQVPVRYVLEVNGGVTAMLGVHEGDHVAIVGGVRQTQ